MTLPAPQVIVIGAGVVGASIAWHLARAGTRVLVIDRTSGPAQGATGRAFGWVGQGTAGPGDDPDLFRFRLAALTEHARVLADLGAAAPAVARGALVWCANAAETEQLIDWRAAQGARVIARTAEQVAAMEPRLRTPPPLAAFAPDDFALDPNALTEALLSAAMGLGTRIWFDTIVSHVEPGAVTVNGSQRIAAPVVILANGAGVAPLVAPLGHTLDITTSPAVLITGTAAPGLAHHILCGPELEIRQTADGSLALAEDWPGPQAPALDTLLHDTRRAVTRTFRGGRSAHLHKAETAARPMTGDGWPMIGPMPGQPGLYVAMSHPGVTLAPFIGRVVADEILHGQPDPQADRFLPR